jgi:3-deoxy-D-manno-octulosonate cytidylyltransferase
VTESSSTGPLFPTPATDVVAVIPARFASQRFPGKPLADLGGRPLLSWVVQAALDAKRVGQVLVATDHEEIAAVAREAGAEAVLTSVDHATGSDRIGEAIRGRGESVVLNVQGDEPLVPSAAIDSLVDLLDGTPSAAVSTLATACLPSHANSSHVVKVVRDSAGMALYFSRQRIPGRHPAGGGEPACLRHVGLYGFRRPALDAFLSMGRGKLERAEGLEQLRFLEAGYRIVVGDTEELSPGVDTPADLERCREILSSRED